MVARKEDMTMSYEFITPEIANEWLEHNERNRSLSLKTVMAYAQDISMGNWDESSTAAIAFDKDGILRDGQHRLKAIIKAGKGIWSYVCRGVNADTIFDYNRKRSTSDQIKIARKDLGKVYSSTRYISVAKVLIQAQSGSAWDNRPVTFNEIMHFTESHKRDLDKFFLRIPQKTVSKISLAVVHLALFMAYKSGEDLERLASYYDLLTNGMISSPVGYPVVAYRNYLLAQKKVALTKDELCRSQYSIYKYLTGSCTQQTRNPQRLIYNFPYLEA